MDPKVTYFSFLFYSELGKPSALQTQQNKAETSHSEAQTGDWCLSPKQIYAVFGATFPDVRDLDTWSCSRGSVACLKRLC